MELLAFIAWALLTSFAAASARVTDSDLVADILSIVSLLLVGVFVEALVRSKGIEFGLMGIVSMTTLSAAINAITRQVVRWSFRMLDSYYDKLGGKL